MDAFWQGAAGALIACVLAVILDKQGKDSALLLTLGVCCMVGGLAVSYLSPVISFLRQLADMSQLENDMLETLLKAVGIGLVGELAALICADSGNAALGKATQILSAATLLWLSLPLLTALLELLEDILGGL